ncbi:hypothetical protein Q3G72_035336 [Acer saccharum]|nr:hypothetical protein Q3G72_035336 [Acer saccharum]
MLPSLEELHLPACGLSTIPSSVPLVNLTSVSVLELSNNGFNSSMPSWLFNLTGLVYVDLNSNNFQGSIPSCLRNLSGMASDVTDRYEGQLLVATKGAEYLYMETLYLVNSIDLSNNSLSGEVPDLRNLSRLNTLNLSMNHLTGKIPEITGSLQRLETLDLSRNQLSGQIPPSLTSLTFLAHLNLSYNNLSGEIPSTNQFQTLNDPSIYQGNPALCGSPLSNKCKKDRETSQSPEDGDEKRDNEDEANLEKALFYSSIGLGSAVGFWGVCGTLTLNKSWRVAYFRYVDDKKDKLILVVLLCLARFRRLTNRDGS